MHPQIHLWHLPMLKAVREKLMNEGLSCSELGKIMSGRGGHATSMREPYLN